MKHQKAIQLKEDILYIWVHVTPNASVSVFPSGFDSWRNCIGMKVRAEAKDDKANQEVISVIAGCFDIASSQVRILSGLKERIKLVGITGSELEQIRQRLEEMVHGL